MPAPYAITDFAAAVPGVLSDGAGKTTALLPSFAQRAILERYSQDSPLWIVSDVAGNGGYYMPMPVAPSPPWPAKDAPVWETNFSVIKKIEFPIGQQPPQLVLDSDISVYRTPGAADQILINFDIPEPGQFLRVTWSARHLIDGSTVPDRDFYAVVDFIGSMAAEWLASYYVGVGDTTMNVDVTNYRSKSQEMLNVAKTLRKRYYNHMGVEEGANGEAEVGPAISLGNQFLEQNSGVDRLVHDKYSR